MLAAGVMVGATIVPYRLALAGTGFQVNAGFSTMDINVGSSYSGDGGIGLEMRPQINFESNALNAALDIFYQGRLGSNIGSFPLSRLGLGLYYYPTGLPLQTVVMDNGVTLTQNHFAPFITGNVTLASVAVTDVTVSSDPTRFNGLAIGYQIGGGAEMPLSQSWSMVVTFLYEGALSGGSTGGASERSGISFTAVSGFLGVGIHP